MTRFQQARTRFDRHKVGYSLKSWATPLRGQELSRGSSLQPRVVCRGLLEGGDFGIGVFLKARVREEKAAA